MFIEDEELRNVFKTASEEHLQKLDDGFLYLEKNPDDAAKLEELLRETHSLKGDAGMLGVKDVSTLAHQIEHLLGSIKRGETALTLDVSDRFSQGLEAIRRLVHEAVTGEPSGINTFYILATLMGAAPNAQSESRAGKSEVATHSVASDRAETTAIDPTDNLEATEASALDVSPRGPTPPVAANLADPPPLTETPVSHPLSQPAPHPVVASPSVPPTPPKPSIHPVSSSTYRIETIRVATQNLDALMTQAGELTVTKIRLAHRLAEIEEITLLWEEWSRDAFLNRFVLHDLENKHNGTGKNGSLTQLQQYHQHLEDRLKHLGASIERLRTGIYEDTARLDLIADELEEGIRTLRLLPLSTIFSLFPRMVRDLARQEGKEVELIIEGGETRADKRILEEMKDPLLHLVRNAIDHGIEAPEEREKQEKPRVATLKIRGYQTATNIIIEVADDGRGLDIERIKQTAVRRNICTPEELAGMTVNQIQSLIFAPGFSTRTFVTEVSGRGVGLDVVRTNVEALKGVIQVESAPGKGSTFRLLLGTTLATAHVLIVAVAGIVYALPVEFVQTTRQISETEIFSLEGRATIIFDGYPLSVAYLSDLLELDIKFRLISKNEGSEKGTNINWFAQSLGGSSQKDLLSRTQALADDRASSINSLSTTHSRPCIILKVGEERLGIFVEALIDEQDVVLKPQSRLLKRVRNIAGATILGTGEVCMVLNPQDLIKSVRQQASVRSISTSGMASSSSSEPMRKQVVLLAEDSIATRTQEKRILEAAGYEVVTAVDGADAFNKLKTRSFDAVISDVQMPNLDGLGLTAKIRQNKEYSELPIILVTSLASDEDKKRGADAGANAYITKGAFNQEVLLETLKRLV